MNKTDVERRAMDAAEEAALSFCESRGTMDMGTFTEDDGKAFIAGIIDAYSLELMKGWTPEQLVRIGLPGEFSGLNVVTPLQNMGSWDRIENIIASGRSVQFTDSNGGAELFEAGTSNEAEYLALFLMSWLGRSRS